MNTCLSPRNRQILRIALPSIVSNITVPLLGLIDAAITGHLGAAAYIGAVSVGGMVFNFIYWMFAFLRMGTSGMTAQAYGREDMRGIVRMAECSLGTAFVLSLLLLVCQVLVGEGAMAFVDPSDDVRTLAFDYFYICIWGAPASLGLFALNGWFIGMQNSRIPMVIAISQNVINIVASLTFVYGLGMKVEGIALGTVLAQWAGFGMGMAMLNKRYSYLKKHTEHPDAPNLLAALLRMKIDYKEMFAFFRVNKDLFIRTLCLLVVHFCFLEAGARQGDMELAANSLLMQLFTLYSYIMDGFAFAGEAIAGKAVGARDSALFHDVVKRLFGWGMLMVVLFTVAYALGGSWFMGMLTDDADVIATINEYLPWTLLFPICGLACFIWDGIYIGATATKYMMVSMATGMVVFVILYNTIVSSLGNHGLWIAFISYLATRGIVQTITRKRIVSF